MALERALQFLLLPRDHVAEFGHRVLQVRKFLFDGIEAWGEDQDMWPVHRWAQFRRGATR